MELPINIGKATLNDIPQLEKLINSAYRGDESKKGWTTEADLLEGKRIDADGIEKLITQPGSVILKCCNGNNDLIGCVYLKKNSNRMYLGMLTVSPTLQAGGIGKKIMKASEEYAVENNCDIMKMRVVSVRDALIAWYKRHGYNDTGKTEPFGDASTLSVQKQPLEFIIMEKIL